MVRIEFTIDGKKYTTKSIDFDLIVSDKLEQKVTTIFCYDTNNNMYIMTINWDVPYINIYKDITKKPLNNNPIFNFNLIF